jgi:hypothetical protein
VCIRFIYYGLDSRGLSPTEAEDFSSNLCVQTSLLYNGYGGSLTGGTGRAGRDADHSSHSRAKIKKE